ncbi:MAG: WYL domain-containing protein [Burkholderiales bacterium]|nr:WYL domain-containing protein [Burkholderiales bacterium]
MERTERFYRIQQLLHDRRVVPFTVFLETLEVSRATVKRDLEYLRNRMNAPIAWDPEARGYRFAAPDAGGGQYELPGLWFNASEIHALLTMQHLLAQIEPGVLAPQLMPIADRLRLLLGSGDHSVEEVQKRVRVLGMAARRFDRADFAVVGSALLRRKRLHLHYYVRSRDELTEREVSPQRLVYYRDNWYLDAWCHRRDDLRSFAIDAIRDAEILDKKARDIPESTLNRVLGSGYGIFSGHRVRWGRLRFTPERARWVAAEEWHSRQRGRVEADGSYVLEVPYNDDRELVMDILRHGPDVEVLGPSALRRVVRERLAASLERYRPRRGKRSG